MKRKIKLFSAIASLCLAVALMAFGVYAAATAKYTVTGQVSYQFDHVLVEVTSTFYNVENYHLGHANAGAVSTAVNEVVTWKDVSNETLKTYKDGNLVADEFVDDAAKTHTQDVNLNTSSLWKVVITVKTVNTNGVNIKLASSCAATNVHFIKDAQDATYAAEAGATLANNTPLTLTYYVALEDPTLSSTTGALSIILNFDNIEA